MKEISVSQLLDISIALSSEKDGDLLLENILTTAMDWTDCDGGSLYIFKENFLHFELMITRSSGILKGGKHEPITLPPVPITRANVCACAVLDRSLINVANIYDSKFYDFSGLRRYDELTGYHTQSMLVVPMENDKSEIIGVLQLINALDADGNTVPFPAESERLLMALTSLAAISLTNMNYAIEVRELLDSLVGGLSTAIDARTPYNVNHTRNMAQNAARFLDWLDTADRGWQMTEAEKRQFLLSVRLHDVGKLTMPLEVMDKESRLGAVGLERVCNRLRSIALLERLRALEEGRDPSEVLEQLEQARALVESINVVGFLQDEKLAEVEELAARRYVDEYGETQPWLTQEEIQSLSVRKGTLTQEERKIMEQHVSMTTRILSEVKFHGEYSFVPKWAGEHHEFLNGTGYPKGLKGDEISRETRLLTILDVFDALTARDRPYKPPLPLDKALGILHNMVRDGQLDGEILEMFEESRAWEDISD